MDSESDRQTDIWRWTLGLVYIVAVAAIWIAASYIVQSVVDAGVSPFLITYICNSLFVIYIPIVEIARYLEDSIGSVWFWCKYKNAPQERKDSENANLLEENDHDAASDGLVSLHNVSTSESGLQDAQKALPTQGDEITQSGSVIVSEDCSEQLDAKGNWTRTRIAKVSLLICPFWFFAQLTFNLSLKYTTVTSNTILSSTSSLFTFLVSLAFLGEKFTWVKLISVLLCMGGTVIVSMADSKSGVNAFATNPLLGDILALVSSGFYAVYITLIRKKLPDETKGQGQASMAQFLGFLGLFNLLIFLPIALVLNFMRLEPFHRLTWNQIGLIVGKGLLDNVLSDYLWAKAVQLTTTTVATAGLTIQVPISAIVDSLMGHAPHLMDYLGAAAVMIGFAGINIPSDLFSCWKASQKGEDAENVSMVDKLPITGSTATVS